MYVSLVWLGLNRIWMGYCPLRSSRQVTVSVHRADHGALFLAVYKELYRWY